MEKILSTTQGSQPPIIGSDDVILITGANGFIGTELVEILLEREFRNLRCLVRSTVGKAETLREMAGRFRDARLELVQGDLKSLGDAVAVTRGARLVFHLAASSEKSYPGCFANTVVSTRNLLEGVRRAGCVKRFVNISSLSVYSNRNLARHALLDETCPLEPEPVRREEAYVYAKLKQDELVLDFAKTEGLPYVLLRPGAVYGPGKSEITGRVGIGTFGLFLHISGGNVIPFTHVRNCADAIALAGIVPGLDGEVFNIVDDDLPTGRQFMSGYRKHVERRRYLSVPYWAFYAFCALWERYSEWSEGQLPPSFNRYRCAAYWKGNRYSNRKLKERVGWQPSRTTSVGMRAYFDYLRAVRTPSC